MTTWKGSLMTVADITRITLCESCSQKCYAPCDGDVTLCEKCRYAVESVGTRYFQVVVRPCTYGFGTTAKEQSNAQTPETPAA